MSIRIGNVSKEFGNFAALDDVSLEVPDGDLLALLGPSGSGKTTLLRIIAGLEVADSGSVSIGGDDITGLSARERNIGFVFQHYALFRHMTIADNIGYGLRVRNVSRAKIRDRVRELLHLVRLDGLDARYPGQISGGQRQRVALARALAAEPRVLLLDEPFGALDAKVRHELRQWLRKLHDEIHVTSIFVTHDQEEAMELADRVVVMNRGRIEQIGSTEDLYERPASPFVFDFLGETNVLPGAVRDGSVYLPGVGQPISTESIHTAGLHPGGPVDVYVRPADLRLADAGAVGIDVRVMSIQRTGPVVKVTVETVADAAVLHAEFPHLHHDVPRLVVASVVRLRLMQFSVYSRGERLPTHTAAAPVPTGRERERRREEALAG
ncbi:MAG TPA: sulfate ABC transporter ATP-binding protein [Candidatus Binatia bacterium]|jgi:sulfate transport system ATP-binding protein